MAPPEHLHADAAPTPHSDRIVSNTERNDVQFTLARRIFGSAVADEDVVNRWVDEGYAAAFGDCYTANPSNEANVPFRATILAYLEHGTDDDCATILAAINARRLQ